MEDTPNSEPTINRETTEERPSLPTAIPNNEWGRIGVWIAVGAAALLILMLAFMVNGANKKADERELNAVKRGLERASDAFAAALLPMLEMRNQKTLSGGDDVFQRIVDNVAEDKDFELALITDNQGRIIASSNRNFAANSLYSIKNEGALRNVDGAWESLRPVKRADIRFGFVALRGR